MKQIFKKVIVTLLLVEAKLVLKKYKPKIVAITGSVGKTTTKDAIYSVLSTSFFVRKSSKSFNSEIGVPLTILGQPNAWNDPYLWFKNFIDGINLIIFPHKYPEWLVLEVGADRPGDIRSVARWLNADVAVITRLSDVPVHIEFFDSAEQVRHEKSQLVIASHKASTVVLNADDVLVSSMRPLAKGKVLTYGTAKHTDVSGSDFDFVYDHVTSFPTGIHFNVHVSGDVFPVVIEGAIGRQQMYTALAALAVAKSLKIDMQKAVQSLHTHVAPPGRMKIIAGMNSTCIIDDTYNSSPVAVSEALDTLKEIKASGRKIVVLGDMLELGSHSKKEHEKVGVKSAQIADVIYTVGTRSRNTFDAAIAAGFPKENIFEFDDSVEAGTRLREDSKPGDIVLIKGSQGKRMEKATAMLLAEPERAKELLVRQEKEWEER